MKRQLRIAGLAALPVLFLGACAQEPDQDEMPEPAIEAAEAPADQRPVTPFEDWDVNQDQALQVEEFTVWTADEGKFDEWVDDEGLDREAFLERTAEVWDANGDAILTRAEWEAGVSEMYGDASYGTYEEWDTNGDSELQPEEIEAGHEAHGFYAQIDGNQDAVIADDEISAFIFDVFDRNDDARVDQNEFEYGRVTWFGDEPGA
jgi:hypothetical protein